jgi:hypothetical protein
MHDLNGPRLSILYNIDFRDGQDFNIDHNLYTSNHCDVTESLLCSFRKIRAFHKYKNIYLLNPNPAKNYTLNTKIKLKKTI